MDRFSLGKEPEQLQKLLKNKLQSYFCLITRGAGTKTGQKKIPLLNPHDRKLKESKGDFFL